MARPNTILIVEEALATESHLSQILNREGYHVLQATSGRQALQKLAETAVDLLIIDTQLADMRGVDFLQSVRECPSYAELPVLMLVESELVPQPLPC